LHEATQGPVLPAEIPSLNPTGGVTPKPQISLEYQKDPTRLGGGVFIAQAPREDVIKDLPAGMVITPEESREGLFSTFPHDKYADAGARSSFTSLQGPPAATVLSILSFDG